MIGAIGGGGGVDRDLESLDGGEGIQTALEGKPSIRACTSCLGQNMVANKTKMTSLVLEPDVVPCQPDSINSMDDGRFNNYWALSSRSATKKPKVILWFNKLSSILMIQ